MYDKETGRYTGIPELDITPEEEEFFDYVYRREMRLKVIIGIVVVAAVLRGLCWLFLGI